MHRLICVLLFGAALALCQSAAFDAASVRLHTGQAVEQSGPWMEATPGTITMRNAKLTWCLAWAYDTKAWLIFGPGWIDSERYDILAKADHAAPPAEMKLMMQGLLQERFKLTLRHETRELVVQVLAVSKKGTHNLTAAASDGPPDGPRRIGGGMPSALAYKNVTMPDFAERLSAQAPLGIGAPEPVAVEDKVVDATGLTGAFDLTVKLDGIEQVGGRNQFIELLKACLDRQFGLVLEQRKMAIDTLIIDRGARIPTEN